MRQAEHFLRSTLWQRKSVPGFDIQERYFIFERPKTFFLTTATENYKRHDRMNMTPILYWRNEKSKYNHDFDDHNKSCLLLVLLAGCQPVICYLWSGFKWNLCCWLDDCLAGGRDVLYGRMPVPQQMVCCPL